MNANGLAKVGAEVVDISVLINTGLKGIHAFLGETERGFGNKLVGTWAEYKKHFGGLVIGNDFPLLCKRALDAGCKLRVGRVLHYTDVTDKSTITGVASQEATNSFIEAKSIGTWGNKVKFKIVANSLGKYVLTAWIDNSGAVTEEEEFELVSASGVLTAEQAQLEAHNINTKSNLLNCKSATLTGFNISTIVDTSFTLTLGTNTGTLVDADYTGDSGAETGVHVFDNATDFTRISIPAKAIPALDIKLVAYVNTRQDCRVILRTPTGITGATAIEYREGTGAWSHTAINSWLASMVYGGLLISHPVTGLETEVRALSSVAGNYSNKDNTNYEWFTAAGSKRGKIYGALGIGYNLGSAARITEANNVDTHGINPVIDDADYGLVYWGNSTLQKEDTLLKHENVADLLIFILRAVKPLAKSELFEPNDIATWKSIWRKVNPLLKEVKKKRGIWDYLYQGDQNIDKIEQAVVNSTEDIDKGKYTFILWIKPKVGLKYVGVKVTVTNSGTSFEEVSGQPN